jgi:hypothetical protein
MGHAPIAASEIVPAKILIPLPDRGSTEMIGGRIRQVMVRLQPGHSQGLSYCRIPL